MNYTLIIRNQLFDRVVSQAQDSAPDECMGFLARRPDGRPGRATAACLLPALATPSSAEANPIDIRAAVIGLRERGLVPFGLWHSHGDGHVHHSSVDDETVLRLLPAMAELNYERPRAVPLVPCVAAPDEAELPLMDGTTLQFTLLGPALPGMEARRRVAWSSVTSRFLDRAAKPRAVQELGRLQLIAGSVVLTLGLPIGSTLESRVVDRAPVRSARLFSLVVNTSGAAYTEVIEIHDIDGESIIRKHACSIEFVETGTIETMSPRGVKADRHGGCVSLASEGASVPRDASYLLDRSNHHDNI